MDYNNDIIIRNEEEDSLDSIYESIVGVHSHETIEDQDFSSISDSNGSSGDECHETPNGTRYWTPDNVPEHFKPVDRSVWANPDDAFAMYQIYAEKSGFDVRRGSEKKMNDGTVSHKYFMCHKAGMPKKKNATDTLAYDSTSKGRLQRNSSYKVTNCQARIKLKLIKGTDSYELYGFEEAHNHPLIDPNHSHLSRARRQLTFDEKLFIQTVSTNNIGATKAHRLRAALKGGYDKVRGTVDDFKNWKAKLNLFIGERDAQMVVDKFRNRKLCLPEFSFEFKCENNELVGLFWADETSKCNYKEFGDVICFDATYKTNKYCMVFVPFTGIDNHNRCVTFGAGLLKNENIESYTWLLNAFLKCHNRQPTLVLTDQDPALLEAVKTVLNESHHRLCMWHIMKKLPLKVCTDMLNNTDLRKRLHKLVWNVYLDTTEFEQRWMDLITDFNLEDNQWLKDMFEIRQSWIPSFFNHLPMCCLMKTTSRSESSNAFFKVFSHKSNTLVQFMLCFETAMEKQRHAQSALDAHTSSTNARMLTPLPIELFASNVYTRSIFFKVQKEIYKGAWSCSQELVQSDDANEVYQVKHSLTASKSHMGYKVSRNTNDGSIVCSCNHFGRHGYFCRHIFSVMKNKNIEVIPDQYIMRRWRQNVLPRHLSDKCHRYVNKHAEADQIGSKAISGIELCLSRLRHDPVMFASFVDKVNKLSESTIAALPTSEPAVDDEQIFMDLLGVQVPEQCDVFPPKNVNNKGSGTNTGKRYVNPGEKHVKKRKRLMRKCKYCGEIQDNHDIRNCEVKKKDEAEARLAAKRGKQVSSSDSPSS